MRIDSNRMLRAALAGTVMAIAGLAAADQRTIPETRANDCAFFRSVYDWRALDDRNLVIWAPSRTAYQVTLSFPVSELRYAESIAFVDNNADGRLCGFGLDAVIVPGAIPERVTIAGMARLDDARLAQLLEQHKQTASRRHSADAEPPPQPDQQS